MLEHSEDEEEVQMEVELPAIAPSPNRRRKGEKNSTYTAGDRSNASEHIAKLIALDEKDDDDPPEPRITVVVDNTTTQLDPSLIPLPTENADIPEPPDGSTEGGKEP